ncbi:MAG: metallophosphoesterase [Candidatus Eisenbacteria bacterium]
MSHKPRMALLAGLFAATLLTLPCLADDVGAAGTSRAVGDTLTVLMRPILSVPTITVPGGSFTIEARASSGTTGWTAALERNSASHALTVDGAAYSGSFERWFIDVTVPLAVPEEMYALTVSASGGVADTEAHAVMVRQSIDDSFYFVQVTDTHLPTHLYYYQDGADTDTSEMSDLHAVIDDINIMNPAFVLLTGDVINEGELEDFLDKRYFTRTKRILQKLDVPVFLSAGNHDIGGWDDTPPADGTARRTWWRFFGWSYLYDPPSGDNIYTQNYSFDYGGAHFVSLEAYNNYDRWRRPIYGTDSFTTKQLSWMVSDLSAAPPSAPVVAFYHMDFDDEINLGSLGIDCALWGHIHSSSGSTGSPPFNLSLDNACDGGRAMRVVRIVNGSTVDPSEPIEAGSTGYNLRRAFEYANDGTRETNAASIINNQPEDFEHAIMKFRMAADSAPYEVDVGELFQTVTEGSVATCYVKVNAQSSSVTVVNISPQQGSGVEEDAVGRMTLLGPSYPNPALEGASIAFSLGSQGAVTVEVYDVAGRRVRTVEDAVRPSGPHAVTWDLRDESGETVSAGVYLWRISGLGTVLSSKLVVL